MANEALPGVLERVRRHLVGLKMPCALETLDATLRQLERGELSSLEAIEHLLGDELTTRETRRIKMALVTARLTTIKTLASFDFRPAPHPSPRRRPYDSAAPSGGPGAARTAPRAIDCNPAPSRTAKRSEPSTAHPQTPP